MATGNSSIRYLNLDRIAAQEKSAKRLMIFGCILATFFGFAIFACFFKLGSEEPIPKSYLPGYVLFFFISLIPILISRKKSNQIKAASRYETIFGSDTDGIITADELSTLLQKPSFKIFEELEVLFKKGFFQNCNLQQGGNPCVKIDNALVNDTAGTGFVEVKCKNCGGTNRIRADSSSVCSYCGGPLLGKIES